MPSRTWVQPGGDSTDQGTTRWIISWRVCPESWWTKMLLASNCHKLFLDGSASWKDSTSPRFPHGPSPCHTLRKATESLCHDYKDKAPAKGSSQETLLRLSALAEHWYKQHTFWYGSMRYSLEVGKIFKLQHKTQKKFLMCNSCLFTSFFCTPSTIPNQVMTLTYHGSC